MSYKIICELKKCIEQNKKVAMVILTENTGSSPGVEGEMMLVYPDGTTSGTIGGGSLEYNVTQEVLEKMDLGENFGFSHDLSESGDLGMICGGRTSGYVKYFQNRQSLVIFGAGHVSQALVGVVEDLGFEITIVDDREQYLSNPVFANVNRIHCPFDKLSEEIPLKNAYVVIMTPSHSYDYEVLRSVIESDFEYLGLMGSRKKVKLTRDRLISDGASMEKVKKLNMPVGLNIATGTPKEIAISIAAEILAIKNGKENIEFLTEKF